MKTRMKFYCILSIDIRDDRLSLSVVKPKCVTFPRFHRTEKSLFWIEPDVKIHRKYCGILSYEELLTLIEQINVQEVNHTQGMLTIEYGHLPAISMSDNWDGRSDITVYVSPVFDDETELKLQRELGVLTQMARDIIIDTTTQPHFDKIMKLLYKADDYDALERLGTLIETEMDIQPMLPLVA